MSERKEQKIVVLINLTPSDKSLILNGIKIASVFNKELCLVYHYKKKEKKKRNSIRQKLQDYLIPVKNEIPEMKTSTLLISGPVSEMPDLLADDYDYCRSIPVQKLCKGRCSQPGAISFHKSGSADFFF